MLISKMRDFRSKNFFKASPGLPGKYIGQYKGMEWVEGELQEILQNIKMNWGGGIHNNPMYFKSIPENVCSPRLEVWQSV